MASFAVGDIVEFHAPGSGSGAYQHGDRGEILRRIGWNGDAFIYNVRWFLSDVTANMCGHHLRRSEDPFDVEPPSDIEEEEVTPYARKRRLLRQHREEMRIMDSVITSHGLDGECDQLRLDQTGNTGFWLGVDAGEDGMDESDDEDDPMLKLYCAVDDLSRKAVRNEKEMTRLREENAALRNTARDQKVFCLAVQGALECRSLMVDIERSHMQLEDMRSRACRV